jgi:general secretion pathway protein E
MINIVKDINDLLDFCISQKVSDVHIEPLKGTLRIRYRKDGILKLFRAYTKEEAQHYLARLKIMANLDINDRNIQDGRFTYNQVDIRMSILPVFWGEKAVLRLLFFDLKIGFNELGLPDFILRPLQKMLLKESGLILVTGPTGSGKTTTLYSMLKLFDCSRKNIVTIEDPVEYQLDGINQVQVNYHQDINFIKVLKAVLRQDPDIIFIGEIRDSETATIAFRAALTGHLVLATLHTRSAAETITRLKDLGVADYLVQNTINCILSQRLYRKKCQVCEGSGCKHCDQEGFYGRAGIFEYFSPVNQEFFGFPRSREHVLSKNLTDEKELFFLS